MKKQKFISYFLLVVFTIMYTHQFVPHHTHASQEDIELSSCEHHKVVECSTNSVSSFSHFISHIFNCDYHIDTETVEVVQKKVQLSKSLKTIHSSSYDSNKQDLGLNISKITSKNNSFSALFYAKSISYRGPPSFSFS